MRIFGVIPLVIVLLIAGSWLVNLFKLTNCDFEAPYRCEVIHAAGIIPPVALVTAWIASDK